MNNQPLPDNDHISRYCKPSHIGQNGMLLPAAFLPRRGERYLSVNWLEYFDKADLGDAIEEVREVFRRKGYKVKSNGRFAVLEVGAAKAVGDTLSIKHLPSINDESHAGISGDIAVLNDLRDFGFFLFLLYVFLGLFFFRSFCYGFGFVFIGVYRK